MKKRIGAPRGSTGKPSPLTRRLQDSNSAVPNSHEPGGLLAHIFWYFAKARDINPAKWQHLLQVFERKFINPNLTSKKKSSIRGNLTKALVESAMSFKTFFRGFVLLGVVKLKITIEAEFENREVIKGEFPIKFSDSDISRELEDESKDVDLIDLSPDAELPTDDEQIR